MSDTLSMYVMYQNPKDYPGKFVVRRWAVKDEKAIPCEAELYDSYQEALEGIPGGAVRLATGKQDDAVIVGTWI